MFVAAHRRRAFERSGVSILEFLGCLSALAGGVVLGSMYLGVDVKDMAFAMLEQAKIVEPRPKPSTPEAGAAAASPEAAAAAPEAPAADAPQTAPASAAADAPSSDAGTASTEAASTPTSDAPAPAASEPAAAPSLPEPAAGLFAREDLITPEQRRALTTAYWDALGACMKDEVKHRVPAIDTEGNWQLFDYLTGRKNGHLKAVAAIAALDQRGVDDHVLAYSNKARSWHEDGAKLFGRAVDLLTDAPTAQLSGPFAQSWQSAATQHRMEERLLAEKEQAVRTYLAHTYDEAAGGAASPSAASGRDASAASAAAAPTP